MNPRIQELAEQAERLARDELAHLERVHNRLYSHTEGREIYNEKFALLIVSKCADVVRHILIQGSGNLGEIIEHKVLGEKIFT